MNTCGKSKGESELNTTVHLDTTFMHIRVYTNLRDRWSLQEETKTIQTFYITAKSKKWGEEFNISRNAGQTLIMTEMQISKMEDLYTTL
jgi:hypothetical protein